MQKREVIQRTQERLLDVTSTDEATEVMKDYYAQLDLHHEPSDSLHKEFEKSKAVARPIYSAMGELAWRKIVEEMSACYSQRGSLEREDLGTYEVHSPMLRRFMATMDAWLSPVLQEFLDDAAEGKMPHGAIYEVMKPARARRLQSTNTWQKPQALVRGEAWEDTPEDPGEFFKAAWTRFNLPHVASVVLGRAIAMTKDFEMSNSELAPRLLDSIDQMAGLSSAVRGITIPIMETSPQFLKQYSDWELGKVSTEDFLAYCQTNPWCTNEAYHPALENDRLKNSGYCHADATIVRPDRFPVRPDAFLRQLGVNEPGEITLTKLFVASSVVMARDTILTILPR